MMTKHADVAHEQGSPDPTSPPWWAWGCGAELTRVNLINMRRYLLLTAVWAVSLVLGLLTLRAWGEALGPLAYAVALAPTVTFLGVVWAYSKFLRAADELTRKIHVDAMAIGFGAGLVWVLGYPVLEAAGAPALELGDAVFPMVIGYVLAVFIGQRRYR